MAEVFYIKRNDTSPAIRANLLDGDGNAVDVTAATIRFHMSEPNGTVVIDAAGTIVNAAGGIVEYQWQAGDTDTAGYFNTEFEVTYGDGTIETFPNSTYQRVRIIEDLA